MAIWSIFRRHRTIADKPPPPRSLPCRKRGARKLGDTISLSSDCPDLGGPRRCPAVRRLPALTEVLPPRCGPPQGHIRSDYPVGPCRPAGGSEMSRRGSRNRCGVRTRPSPRASPWQHACLPFGSPWAIVAPEWPEPRTSRRERTPGGPGVGTALSGPCSSPRSERSVLPSDAPGATRTRCRQPPRCGEGECAGQGVNRPDRDTRAHSENYRIVI